MMLINSYYFTIAGATYQFSRILDSAGADQGMGVTTDSSGNVYLAGLYTGTPTIKDQNGYTIITLPASVGGAGQTAFVCKFNSSGAFQYSRLVDGSGVNDQGLGVACDSSGNMYLAGFYAATPTIYDQAGTSLGTLPVSAGSNAAFVCKFDSTGAYQYSRIIDSIGNDQGMGVACDTSGNMYLAGFYAGTPTIKDQAGTSLGTLPATLGGTGSTAFVSKFNSTGTYQYSRLVDASANTDQALGVACDSTSNLYFSGYYTGTPTIYDQAGTSLGTLPASNATTIAAFACKFDGTGNYLYSRIVDGSSSDQGMGVACDLTGNVYLAGFYTIGSPILRDQAGNPLGSLPAPFGGSSSAAFVSKFNIIGTYQYSRLIDASAAADQAMGVSCDSSNNMYLAGFYAGTANIYDQGSNVLVRLPTAIGSSAAFGCKFDSLGNHVYSRIVDSSAAEQGMAVTSDPSGNMYLAGYYTGNPIIYDQNGNTLGSLTIATSTGAFVVGFDSSGNIVTNTGAFASGIYLDGTADDRFQAVACDSTANVYAAGFYTVGGTATLFSQSARTLGTLPVAGGAAACACKFNSSGNYLYSRIIDGSAADQGMGVACDPNGNMYLAGYYNTVSPTIKDQAGTSLGTLPAPFGGSSSAAFVSKFNITGAYQYSRLVDSSANTDQALGVACDSTSNLYLSGYYVTTANVYDQAGTVLVTLPASNAGSVAAFSCKFDGTGNHLYSRIVDGSSADQGMAITSDPSGNMYLAGFYTGTPILRDQAGNPLGSLPLASSSTQAAFVSKFNITGTYQYSRIVDSSAADQGLGVACDTYGNMYLAGYYSTAAATIYDQAGTSLGTLPATSSQAAFVCKFDSTGAYQYSRIIDGAGNDQALGVTCDSDNNVYVCGIAGGTLTIKNESGTTLTTLTSFSGGYVVKFNSSGTYQYSRARLVGTNQVNGISCDVNKNVYLAGYGPQTVTLSNENLTQLATYVNATVTNMGFLIKLDPSENIPTPLIDSDISLLGLGAGTSITTQLTGWTATNNPTYQTAGGINSNRGYIRFTNTNTTNTVGLPQWMYWTGGNKVLNAQSNRGWTILLYFRTQAQNTANSFDRIFHIGGGTNPGMIWATGGGASSKVYNLWSLNTAASTNSVSFAQGQWTLFCGRLNNNTNTFDAIYQTAAGVFTKSSFSTSIAYYNQTIVSADRGLGFVIAESENYLSDDAYFNGDFTRITLWDQPLSDSVIQQLFRSWI